MWTKRILRFQKTFIKHFKNFQFNITDKTTHTSTHTHMLLFVEFRRLFINGFERVKIETAHTYTHTLYQINMIKWKNYTSRFNGIHFEKECHFICRHNNGIKISVFPRLFGNWRQWILPGANEISGAHFWTWFLRKMCGCRIYSHSKTFILNTFMFKMNSVWSWWNGKRTATSATRNFTSLANNSWRFYCTTLVLNA